MSRRTLGPALQAALALAAALAAAAPGAPGSLRAGFLARNCPIYVATEDLAGLLTELRASPLGRAAADAAAPAPLRLLAFDPLAALRRAAERGLEVSTAAGSATAREAGIWEALGRLAGELEGSTPGAAGIGCSEVTVTPEFIDALVRVSQQSSGSPRDLPVAGFSASAFAYVELGAAADSLRQRWNYDLIPALCASATETPPTAKLRVQLRECGNVLLLAAMRDLPELPRFWEGDWLALELQPVAVAGGAIGRLTLPLANGFIGSLAAGFEGTCLWLCFGIGPIEDSSRLEADFRASLRRTAPAPPAGRPAVARVEGRLDFGRSLLRVMSRITDTAFRLEARARIAESGRGSWPARAAMAAVMLPWVRFMTESIAEQFEAPQSRSHLEFELFRDRSVLRCATDLTSASGWEREFAQALRPDVLAQVGQPLAAGDGVAAIRVDPTWLGAAIGRLLDLPARFDLRPAQYPGLRELQALLGAGLAAKQPGPLSRDLVRLLGDPVARQRTAAAVTDILLPRLDGRVVFCSPPEGRFAPFAIGLGTRGPLDLQQLVADVKRRLGGGALAELSYYMNKSGTELLGVPGGGAIGARAAGDVLLFARSARDLDRAHAMVSRRLAPDPPQPAPAAASGSVGADGAVVLSMPLRRAPEDTALLFLPDCVPLIAPAAALVRAIASAHSHGSEPAEPGAHSGIAERYFAAATLTWSYRFDGAVLETETRLDYR